MEYQFIVNPKTNRKCNIDSLKGQQILRNYSKNLYQQGGSPVTSTEHYYAEKHRWGNMGKSALNFFWRGENYDFF